MHVRAYIHALELERMFSEGKPFKLILPNARARANTHTHTHTQTPPPHPQQPTEPRLLRPNLSSTARLFLPRTRPSHPPSPPLVLKRLPGLHWARVPKSSGTAWSERAVWPRAAWSPANPGWWGVAPLWPQAAARSAEPPECSKASGVLENAGGAVPGLVPVVPGGRVPEW